MNKKDTICKVDGCNKRVDSKGLCQKHYVRFRKYGDHSIVNVSRHGKYGTPEYNAWASIKRRCNNENNPGYKDYGGRGITVCDEWANNFMAFYNDMGKKPFVKAQIDRIDNNRGYYKENCRWTTATNNMRNTRRTVINPFMAYCIKAMYSRGIYQRILAEWFGVPRVTIAGITTNKTWKEI